MGRASIVGAAETSVGKVRDHNEDAHFIDVDRGIFAVCDGMGGHAAGEVASALAVQVLREQWGSEDTMQVADRWLEEGTPDARKRLIATIQKGVISAHDAIVKEAEIDKSKTGMGTTLVGALVVGGDVVFAHCGDSRAYMVRDGIAMQLTEDHTLLARLLAAGVDVDTSAEGARFKSMLTNALGIGHECKAATFVVPVADGDRFLLCSDGITEYVQEAEIGEVLTTQPSPARAAQRLVELALQRGGGDNATALVVRVLESGETARPAEQLHRDNKAINACPLWAGVSPQGRLRALRIALPRDHAEAARVPAQTLGDRVAWVIIDGEVEQDGVLRGPGSLLYPEALLTDRPLPDKDGLAVAQSEVRALALRSDDFREICDDDPELGELLLAALGAEIARRGAVGGRVVHRVTPEVDGRGSTDPGDTVRITGDLETGPTLPPGKREPVKPAAAPSKSDEDIANATTLPPGARTPAVPDAQKSESQKPNASALPQIPRTPTPPLGARTTTKPPVITIPPADKAKLDRDALARGPTAPQPVQKVPDDKDAKDGAAPAGSPRLHPRGSTPPAERLIVPKAERAAAEAQLDKALADLTVDRTWADLPDDGDEAPPPRRPAPVRRPPTPTDEPEISVEHDTVTVLMKQDMPSEPEISIERLVELEVEEPLNEHVDLALEQALEPEPLPPPIEKDEPSSPEIIVAASGEGRRAKRRTDTPD